MECEMYDYTSYNLGHWNKNKRFKKFRSCTWKTFNIFTTEDGCTWNISHNTESTAV